MLGQTPHAPRRRSEDGACHPGMFLPKTHTHGVIVRTCPPNHVEGRSCKMTGLPPSQVAKLWRSRGDTGGDASWQPDAAHDPV